MKRHKPNMDNTFSGHHTTPTYSQLKHGNIIKREQVNYIPTQNPHDTETQTNAEIAPTANSNALTWDEILAANNQGQTLIDNIIKKNDDEQGNI